MVKLIWAAAAMCCFHGFSLGKKKGDVMQLCFCNSPHTAAVCLYFLFGVFEWLKATVELLLLLHNACCLFFSLDDSILVLWNGGKQVCGVTLKPVSILVWVPPPPQLAALGIYHRQWLLCATVAALSPLRKRYGRERAAGHMCIGLCGHDKRHTFGRKPAFINPNYTKWHCHWLCLCLLLHNNYSLNQHSTAN